MLAILKNIKSNEIAIFQDALKHYAYKLHAIVENTHLVSNNELSKYEFYIANDLWIEFVKKMQRTPQPINSTIKLSYYKANTLKKALQIYQLELPTTSLNCAIIERLKQPLIQQT